VVHHTHAAKAARMAHLLHLAPRNLPNLHKQGQKEASAIACKDYTE
jgi:hypothetical protein